VLHELPKLLLEEADCMVLIQDSSVLPIAEVKELREFKIFVKEEDPVIFDDGHPRSGKCLIHFIKQPFF
jgi:hypothetical protein